MASPASLDQWLKRLAANVKRTRQRQGLTQEELAANARIAPRYLQEIERARTNPSLAMIIRVADALGVDPRSLLRATPLLGSARPGRPRRRDS